MNFCVRLVSVFVAMERWLPLQCAAPNQLTHATAPFPQPSSAGSRQLPCLLEWPEGPKQFSPGQSAAPPWVNKSESTGALKGLNSHYLVIATRVLPLQGIRSRVVFVTQGGAPLCPGLRCVCPLGNAASDCLKGQNMIV